MAPLSTNRIAWQYHSDDGHTYRVAAEKALTDQGVLGGEAWAGTVGPKPAAIQMRRITVSAAGVGSRTVPVYSTDADILNPATTMNVTLHGDTHEVTPAGNVIPEGHIRTSVTKQAT